MTESPNFRLFNPSTMAKPVAGFSNVAEVRGGKLVYTAGQVALDPSGKLVGDGDFRAQIEQVFQNLKLAVEATGGTFFDVIKLNYYIVEAGHLSELASLREVRDRFVNTGNPPASTLLFVSRLARPEWLVEVEAIAVVPDED
ncbi:MAG TPA: RidA family protein [Blastocatellia bacterium]